MATKKVKAPVDVTYEPPTELPPGPPPLTQRAVVMVPVKHEGASRYFNVQIEGLAVFVTIDAGDTATVIISQ